MAVSEPFGSAPADLRELLSLATELAHGAGRIHEEGMRLDLRLETKASPTDLVSQIDRQAEESIVDRLREVRPDDGMLGEEGASHEGTSGVRWIVDPLDGTTNYVYGYPAYAVSIAVEIDGKPRLGVVYDSSRGRLFQAVMGHGAFEDGRRLHVNDRRDLSQALVATGFSYLAEHRVRQGAAAAAILGKVRDIRRGGTAALDLCHVAAGRVDAYWELDLSPWDYAAGGVIVKEAGAELLLAPAALGKGPAVVAAGPALMPAFVRMLREAGALA